MPKLNSCQSLSPFLGLYLFAEEHQWFALMKYKKWHKKIVAEMSRWTIWAMQVLFQHFITAVIVCQLDFLRLGRGVQILERLGMEVSQTGLCVYTHMYTHMYTHTYVYIYLQPYRHHSLPSYPGCCFCIVKYSPCFPFLESLPVVFAMFIAFYGTCNSGVSLLLHNQC